MTLFFFFVPHYRTVSLATQAIVNSVRKTLAAVQANTPERSSPKVQFQSPKAQPVTSEGEPSSEVESMDLSMSGPSSRTPLKENRPNRKNKRVRPQKEKEEKNCFTGGRTCQVGSVSQAFFFFFFFYFLHLFSFINIIIIILFLVAKVTLKTQNF